MPDLLAEIKHERRQAHERLLALVSDLTDEQLRSRSRPHAPAIGFHLFHAARWADHDRQIIGGGAQIWQARNLAAAWELESTDLGATGTGMGMGDEASERLILPAGGVLISYASDSFAAFDDFIETLS